MQEKGKNIYKAYKGKYKWRKFEYNRDFFVEKYIKDRNKANCS